MGDQLKRQDAPLTGDEPGLSIGQEITSHREPGLGGEALRLHLIELLGHPSASLRHEAAMRLGIEGGKQALDNLLDILEIRTDPATQIRVIYLISQFDDERVLPLLSGLLHRTNLEDVIRRSVVQALGRTRSIDAAPTLLDILSVWQRDPELHQLAGDALAMIGSGHGTDAALLIARHAIRDRRGPPLEQITIGVLTVVVISIGYIGLVALFPSTLVQSDIKLLTLLGLAVHWVSPAITAFLAQRVTLRHMHAATFRWSNITPMIRGMLMRGYALAAAYSARIWIGLTLGFTPALILAPLVAVDTSSQSLGKLLSTSEIPLRLATILSSWFCLVLAIIVGVGHSFGRRYYNDSVTVSFVICLQLFSFPFFGYALHVMTLGDITGVYYFTLTIFVFVCLDVFIWQLAKHGSW